MLKRIKGLVPVLLVSMGLAFTGCSDGSSSSNAALLLGLMNQGVTSSVTIESPKSGAIVKNKVVTDDESEYYEYFKFTAEDGTAGEYSL